MMNCLKAMALAFIIVLSVALLIFSEIAIFFATEVLFGEFVALCIVMAIAASVVVALILELWQ